MKEYLFTVPRGCDICGVDLGVVCMVFFPTKDDGWKRPGVSFVADPSKVESFAYRTTVREDGDYDLQIRVYSTAALPSASVN